MTPSERYLVLTSTKKPIILTNSSEQAERYAKICNGSVVDQWTS